MEEHVLNTSDHLPIYLKMSLNNMKVNTEHVNNRNIIKHVKWRHLSEDQIKTITPSWNVQFMSIPQITLINCPKLII